MLLYYGTLAIKTEKDWGEGCATEYESLIKMNCVWRVKLVNTVVLSLACDITW
jgi:hypothetical protein